MSYENDLMVVRRALIRQFKDGYDVGAFLVEASCAAQDQLLDESDSSKGWNYARLTDNRSGSWEAHLLTGMLQGGGR